MLRLRPLGGAMRQLMFVCGLLLLAAGSAAAQASPFIIDQNRGDRATPPPPTAPAPTLAAPVSDAAAVQPFTLTSVTIEGTSLPPDILGAAIKPYVGRTIDTKGLNDIANFVSSLYADQGDIALYTVTVPAQDFAGGVLRLAVTEGYIEHVDLAGDTKGDLTLVTAYADKLTHEKPLRRSTLQRYLSLIRDIPGLTVDVQLLRGQTAGAVRMLLTLTQKDHLLHLSLNDSGASLLGRYQGQADFSLYGLLREGEETKLSFGTSTIFSRYQFYGLSDSEPLDDEGTTAQGSLGYLRTDIGAFALAGDAKTAQLAVSHPLIRSFDENLILSGDIDGIDTRNALLGTALANEKVRAGRLSAGYSLTDPRWALALNASVSQGLGILGARASAPGQSDTDFEKFVAQASYNHLLGAEWAVRLRAATQLAANPLPVSELYALGGPDFGRAFFTSSALGDSGLAGAAEIAWQPGDLPDLLKGVEVFGFGDDGDTWYRARPLLAAQNYHLASAGVGVRFPVGDKTKIELQGADALAANAPGTRPGVWRFLVGLTASY